MFSCIPIIPGPRNKKKKMGKTEPSYFSSEGWSEYRGTKKVSLSRNIKINERK